MVNQTSRYSLYVGQAYTTMYKQVLEPICEAKFSENSYGLDLIGQLKMQ